jgi:hypothetical protein
LGTDYSEFFTITDHYIIAENFTESDMVPTMKPEFLAGQYPLQDIPQGFRLLILLYLFSGHLYPPINAESPLERTPEGYLTVDN